MPEQPSKSRRRFRFVRWTVALAALALVFWIAYPVGASWVVKWALSSYCRQHELRLESATVNARLGRPLRVEGIVAVGESTSRVVVEVLELSVSSPTSWFSRSARVIERLTLRGVNASLNARDATGGGLGGGLTWMPRLIELEGVSVERWDNDRLWAVRRLSAVFSENELSNASVGEIEFRARDWSWVRSSVRAVTAWKSGTLWLGNAALDADALLEEASINLLDPDGIGVSILAKLFGGSLRADFTFGSRTDAALWISNVPVAPLPGLLGLQERMSGQIVEGRLTFLGDLARPADAQASLRLFANGFRWNDRGWESLEVGASLIHQRLIVTDFDLRQKDNLLQLNGEVSIAEGWSQISQSPFLLNLSASIQNLDSLGDLAGGSLNELSGRMSATGSVSGRQGQLDGFLSIESSGIEFRGMPAKSIKLEAVFRRNELEIAQCDVYSDEDFLNGRGVIGLASPHVYAGDLRAKIGDVARFLQPFRKLGGEIVSGGALDARWQGDGTWRAHSGAFELRLERFVSDHTPTGITGQFTGTYSPQNLYFSSLSLSNGPIRLDSRVTLASSGVTVADAVIRSGTSVLLEGAGFIPADPFAALGGAGWTQTFDAKREAYARLGTRGRTQIADLLRLFGQRASWSGELQTDWELRGTAGAPQVDGDFVLERLRFDGIKRLPESDLSLDLKSRDGTVDLRAQFASGGRQRLAAVARAPLGLISSGDGVTRWVNPEGALELHCRLDQLELAFLQPFLPANLRMTGSASGSVSANGSLSKPGANGSVTLSKLGLKSVHGAPALTGGNGTVVFMDNRATLDDFGGAFGGGRLSGNASLTFPDLALSMSLRGEQAWLTQDQKLRLLADFDLTAQSGDRLGSVAGELRVTEGKVHQRLEVTPTVDVVSSDRTRAGWLRWPVPAALANWSLDVNVRTESPIRLRSDFFDGELLAELALEGTLGNPVPVGRLTLRNLRAFLPFGLLDIPTATMDFLPDVPGVPMLDMAGRGNLAGYEIAARAYGELNEGKWLLRSAPELSPEGLSILLTTGRDPEAIGTNRRPISLEMSEPIRLLTDENARPSGAQLKYLWQLR